MDLVIHYSRQSLVDYNQDMTTILETPVGAVKQENVVHVPTRLVPTRDPPAPPGGELGRPAHPPPDEEEVEDFNNHSVFSHADVVAPSEADGANGLTKSGSSEDKNELSENSIENI